MKNVAASVRARLTNQARATGVSLPSLIERFAIGRLLWRLSESAESKRFVLKGAQLFSLWADAPHRPTRDLDLLSFGDPSVDAMRAFFEGLLAREVEPDDGLVWGELSVGPILNDQRYGGVRVSIWVQSPNDSAWNPTPSPNCSSDGAPNSAKPSAPKSPPR